MEKSAQLSAVVKSLDEANPFKDKSPAINDAGERLWAAGSYIYFVSAAVLLLRKDNSDFVIFHAKHAIIFLLLTILFFLIPGWPKVVLSLILISIEMIAVYLALAGKRYTVPFLTNLVRNFDI